MNFTPPPLRTILDLHHTQLRELDSASLKLEAVLAMARAEKTSDCRTVGEVYRLYDKRLEGMPELARIILHKLHSHAPDTMISPLMTGAVTGLSDRPAVAVLWAHALAAWWERTGTPAMVKNILVGHLDGCLPTGEGLLGLWTAQKVYPELPRHPDWPGGDNWLDQPQAWTPAALCAGQPTQVDRA